jgi:error-prone DNA polymerase
MVMTRGPLCELAPIENAAMEGRTVIEWDKDDLDELGILKVDVLALGMLTAIRKCFALIEKHHGQSLTLASIPPDDSAVYDMICRADTMGVFQIESRAQMSMLPRLKPRCYYDLVIEVAIVRPGPIQGQMVHPYLRRRAGEPVPPYPTPEIAAVLHKTLGVPIFQEQAMRLAVVAAGFTPGEADQLRRAMAAWRRPGIIDQFREKLLKGMLAKGLSAEFAENVFTQIRGFGEYGFPESHAASFALLVYVSAWLKHYYPAAFCAAIINSQPMGFYAPAQLVRDAREHSVEVRAIDVNHSEWDCTLEPNSKQPVLRLGLRLLVGLPQAAAETIVRERSTHGPFRSLTEFSSRTRLRQDLIAKLSDADAFASLGRDRRAMLWESLAQDAHDHARPLLGLLEPEDELPVLLPELSPQENVLADYRTAGMSLKAHPVGFYREQLDKLRITPAGKLREVPSGRHVRVAGLVILRQRPSTAKGITFVTLEDETGVANLIVKQDIWQKFYLVARRSPAWIAHGGLEQRDGVIHVVVNRLEDMSACLGDVAIKSRDFR